LRSQHLEIEDQSQTLPEIAEHVEVKRKNNYLCNYKNNKMKKVTKKTAYDIKQASNQKLTASARKHYAENAQAAMKNQKKKK
jgi:hypothetical protein